MCVLPTTPGPGTGQVPGPGTGQVPAPVPYLAPVYGVDPDITVAHTLPGAFYADAAAFGIGKLVGVSLEVFAHFTFGQSFERG